MNGTGNGDANVITGNSGNNVLTGGGSNDTLIGNAGTDTASYTGTLTAANITAVVDADASTAGNQAGWQVVASGGQGTDLLTGIEKVTDGSGHTAPIPRPIPERCRRPNHGRRRCRPRDRRQPGRLAGERVALPGTDLLTGVEKVNDGAGHHFLLVGNGGYATIQEAVDAAVSGDTIIVGPGTFAGAIIGKELTLIGQGAGQTTITTPMTGSPPSSLGFSLVGDIDATAGDSAATVTIKGFSFVGNTVGVRVSSATNLDHLVITNSDFHDNTSNGVGMGSGAPLLSAIDIVNSTFSHNGIVASGNSVNGSGDISLFNFQGNALIKNVTVHGGDSPVANPSNANFAIQLAGFDPNSHAVSHVIGNVVFDNVSVTGAYSKTLLYVQGYTDLDGLTFLNTGTTINGSAGWGMAFAIDPTSDQVFPLFPDTSALAPDVVNLSNVVAVNNIVVNVPPGHPLFAYNGTALATTFAGTPVADQVTGTGGVDVIFGGGGNDTLNGGAGADAMIGGAGNDTYIVDNAGDVVTEALNEGTDTVQTSVSFTLGANVENLTLTGSANINGTGNGAGQRHHRQQRQQRLTGRGNDTLDGGAGADTMIGGAGNDTYVVDNAGDVVDRGCRRGHRHGAVVASPTRSAANVENLTLTGAADINGTGNALATTSSPATPATTCSTAAAGADTHDRRRRQRHLCRRQRRRRGDGARRAQGTDTVQSVGRPTRSAPTSRT